MTLAKLLCILLHTAPNAVDATVEPATPPRAELFVGGGYLGSLGSSGVAAEGGVRVRLLSHLAASVDMGYGVLHSGSSAEDRWWLVPSLELTAPIGPLRVDLGGGVGVAICSGYPDLGTYFQRPFAPDWAYQLTPAGRVYLRATWDRWFARLDAGTLLWQGNSLGFRAGNASPTVEQTSWGMLMLGAKFDL